MDQLVVQVLSLEWRELTKQTDWPHKWLASQKTCSVEKLETLPVGTKPRTSHHPLPGGGMERGSARWSCLKGWERAIISQMNTGTVSKATLGKLLKDRVQRVHMGFSERIDTILNRTVCSHRTNSTNVQSDPHSFHAYHQQLQTVQLVWQVKHSVGFGFFSLSKRKVCVHLKGANGHVKYWPLVTVTLMMKCTVNFCGL